VLQAFQPHEALHVRFRWSMSGSPGTMRHCPPVASSTSLGLHGVHTVSEFHEHVEPHVCTTRQLPLDVQETGPSIVSFGVHPVAPLHVPH